MDSLYERHKYHVIGTKVFGSESVETDVVAYNGDHAVEIANKKNISIRTMRDLGTTTEQVTSNIS